MDWWRRLLDRSRAKVALSDYYLAFTLVNLGDLLLTGFYVSLGGYEANRLARWILDTFGLRGLAVYKFLLVITVVGVCEGIYPTRPRLARSVILGGCAVFAAVILFQLRGIFMLAAG